MSFSSVFVFDFAISWDVNLNFKARKTVVSCLETLQYGLTATGTALNGAVKIHGVFS